MSNNNYCNNNNNINNNGDYQNKQLQEAFNEISNLRCKLDSKSRALVILSQDLLECKRERDEYKLIGDQVKEKYASLKKKIDSFGSGLTGLHGCGENSGTSFAQILCQLKEANKSLLYELEETKGKLIDCEGDVRMLRGQLNTIKRRSINDVFTQQAQTNQHSISNHNKDVPECLSSSSSSSLSGNNNDKHSLVGQLELIKNRNLMLEKDMQSLLDEKEELIVTRDAYKAKVERLNDRLNHLLRASASESLNCSDNDDSNHGLKLCTANMKTLDIEGIIDENNFLKGKIEQLEEEKNRQKNIITKYRSILEKNNNHSKNGACFPLDSKISESLSFNSSNVISSKQVQHFIVSNNLNNLQLSQTSLAHLKSLVIALFEALTDKSTGLALQRKNNRLLGERLEELEEKIKQLKAREKVFLLMRDDTKNNLTTDTSDSLASSSHQDDDQFDDDMNRPNSDLSENIYNSDNHHHSNQDNDDINSDTVHSDPDNEEKIELPSNLKALVEEELAKLKQNQIDSTIDDNL